MYTILLNPGNANITLMLHFFFQFIEVMADDIENLVLTEVTEESKERTTIKLIRMYFNFM
jgi:hypothetical protein